MSSRQDKEKAVNVQVLLRCRPFSDDELRSNAPQVITCNDFQREVAVTQSITGKQFDRVFTFDKVNQKMMKSTLINSCVCQSFCKRVATCWLQRVCHT